MKIGDKVKVINYNDWSGTIGIIYDIELNIIYIKDIKNYQSLAFLAKNLVLVNKIVVGHPITKIFK